MKKSIFFLTLVAMLCLPSLTLGYSVAWYEPYPNAPITGLEVYITGGGTFTGPLTNFTQGDTGGGPALPGWSSFLASNYPGTAVVATGDSQSAVSFIINFDQPLDVTSTMIFYPYFGDRTQLVSPESWNFLNGTWTTQNSLIPGLPETAPTATSPVPEPSTMLLLGSGLIGLAGYGRKKFFKK